jgi:hypothetical protein
VKFCEVRGRKKAHHAGPHGCTHVDKDEDRRLASSTEMGPEERTAEGEEEDGEDDGEREGDNEGSGIVAGGECSALEEEAIGAGVELVVANLAAGGVDEGEEGDRGMLL